ncbi:hypothetical protein PQR34_29990 [Paraburkholderia sediminicola]|uniref:hypothetical protein n=1 Tax=Paraburkholderia sediminicola TaxID=458836 RepID=UPI0038B7ED46
MDEKKEPISKRQATPNDKANSTTRAPEQLELPEIPVPPFRPQWPTHGTLVAQTLDLLLTGERLDQIKFGPINWRLGAYIKKLDYLGWPVKSAPIAHPAKPKAIIAHYWLDTEIILQAKAMRPEGLPVSPRKLATDDSKPTKRAKAAGETSAVDDAVAFLKRVLDGVELLSNAVDAQAAAAGISKRTLERASALLGVKRTRGEDGRWRWRLIPGNFANDCLANMSGSPA